MLHHGAGHQSTSRRYSSLASALRRAVNSPEMSSHGLSLDEALTKFLGEFGPHQRKLLLTVSLLWVSNSMFILLAVFTNKDPIRPLWWQCTDTNDTQCSEIRASPSPNAQFCTMDRSQWAWTDTKKSTISQWDLVCGKSVLSQLVNSAFFGGYLIGSGVFGNMADNHGRRKTLLIALAIAVFSTVMSALSPSYWVFFTSRFLTGIGAAGQAMVTYLLATETVGPSWRGTAGVATQMFFIVGEFVLVGVAAALQPWRLICIATAILGAVSAGLLLPVPESPRWLLAKGRMEEAKLILERVARENKTRMPLDPLATPLPPAGGESQHGVQRMSVGRLLKDRHILRRFVILSYVWCILCLVYYGISYALGGLNGSMYVNFAVAAVAEIPSNVLAAWMIEHVGRHNSLAAGMLLGGVACLICSFCPPGAGQSIAAAVGKFGCAGAFTIASIYTSELFPTLVRSAVLGFENQAARVGGIAAPFVVLLGTELHNSSFPFLVFGVTAVLAGLLIFTLPETLGGTMPETMQDMEAIQSIFTTGAWKKGWRAAGSEMFSTRAHASNSGAAHPSKLSSVAEEGHHIDTPVALHDGLAATQQLLSKASKHDSHEPHALHSGGPGEVRLKAARSPGRSPVRSPARSPRDLSPERPTDHAAEMASLLRSSSNGALGDRGHISGGSVPWKP